MLFEECAASIFRLTDLGQVDAEVIWRKGSVHYITSDQTQSQ
jgi:hypothetical protein